LFFYLIVAVVAIDLIAAVDIHQDCNVVFGVNELSHKLVT